MGQACPRLKSVLVEDKTIAAISKADVAASPRSEGRRERKKRATRHLLEQVAVQLFTARGYDEVTVVDIAAAADVDPTTFFRHFKSKEEVLFANSEEVLERYRDVIAARPAEESVLDAAIHSVAALFVDMLDQNAQVLRARLMMAEHSGVRAYVLKFEDRVTNVLAEGIALRIGTSVLDDPRPYMLAAAIVASTRWLRATEWRNGSLPNTQSIVEKIGPTLHVLRDYF